MTVGGGVRSVLHLSSRASERQRTPTRDRAYVLAQPPRLTCAHVFASSRATRPRGMSKSEGARAPKRCDQIFMGSLVMAEPCFAWTPASVFRHVEGAGTSSTRRWSHPRIHWAGYHRSGPRAAARLEHEQRRCAKGVRAGHCWRRTASNPQPRHLRRASLATMLRTEQHRLNRAPPLAPRQTLS